MAIQNTINLTDTGIVSADGNGIYTGRSIVPPAAGMTVTNANGVAGNPTLALADDLFALEGLTSTGVAVRTAASTWTERTITAGNGIVVTDGDGVSGNPTISSNGPQPGWTNLGISLSAGTFTIHGEDGTALSSTNPAYITLPSKGTPGQLVTIAVTANQSFDDATAGGGSEIVNNLFGTITGDNWGANDLPFFIYGVSNDDEDAIAFMCSRVPHHGTSPVVGQIGAPDDAVADQQGAFFSFENIDETKYNLNPCLPIGSFRMQKDGSDDWTVTTLNTGPDGIGNFQETQTFTFPLGVNGASSGTFFLANSGTAPVFSDNTYRYRIRRDGYVDMIFKFTNDGGTDGAGAVNCLLATPYEAHPTLVSENMYVGFGFATGSAINNRGVFFEAQASTTTARIYQTDSGSYLQNNGFGNGGRNVNGNIWFWMNDDTV